MNRPCLPSEPELAFELDQHLIQGSLVLYSGENHFSCTVLSSSFWTVTEPVVRWCDKWTIFCVIVRRKLYRKNLKVPLWCLLAFTKALRVVSFKFWALLLFCLSAYPLYRFLIVCGIKPSSYLFLRFLQSRALCQYLLA